MTPPAGALLWPFARFAEAAAALARTSGLAREAPLPPLPAALRTAHASFALYPQAEAWVQRAARVGAFDAQTVVLGADEVRDAARAASLLVVLGGDAAHLLVTLPAGRRGRRVRLLTPGGDVVELTPAGLAALLAPGRPGGAPTWQERAARGLGLDPARARARLDALAAAQGEAQPAAFGWMFRPQASAPLAALVRDGRLGGLAARTVFYALAHSALTTGALVALGAAVLAGRVDPGRTAAWALALAATVPAYALLSRAEGELALAIGVVAKRRLFEGALRSPPDEVRLKGVGALLAVTNESQSVDALALGIAFSLLTGGFDLLGASALLAAGPGGGWALGFFALYLLALAAVARRAHRALRRSTDLRLALSDDLLAKMVGQRTRVAQQAPEHWHRGEDDALVAYERAARASDLAALPLRVAARGWTLLGFCALAPALVALAPGPALFVGIAGLLLSAQALQAVAQALLALVEFSAAWGTVGRLFAAARADADDELAAGLDAEPGRGAPLVDLVDVSFRYGPRARPALDGCSLRVGEGERVLLLGPSGGGKSTLAAVLAGLRSPSSGLVLVGGLDQHSLAPEAWRRLVAAAPQFHENHIFANTLAFNLLLGRHWPPMPGDLQECDAVCRELALGDLLDRMPAGLEQLVGETGWQLSHGEKSRVFLARALLQNAPLVVLDESFGALDPETLELCVAAAVRRARSLVVIAHP